jgi:hypothetical protein
MARKPFKLPSQSGDSRRRRELSRHLELMGAYEDRIFPTASGPLWFHAARSCEQTDEPTPAGGMGVHHQTVQRCVERALWQGNLPPQTDSMRGR